MCSHGRSSSPPANNTILFSFIVLIRPSDAQSHLNKTNGSFSSFNFQSPHGKFKSRYHLITSQPGMTSSPIAHLLVSRKVLWRFKNLQLDHPKVSPGWAESTVHGAHRTCSRPASRSLSHSQINQKFVWHCPPDPLVPPPAPSQLLQSSYRHHQLGVICESESRLLTLVTHLLYLARPCVSTFLLYKKEKECSNNRLQPPRPVTSTSELLPLRPRRLPIRRLWSSLQDNTVTTTTPR